MISDKLSMVIHLRKLYEINQEAIEIKE